MREILKSISIPAAQRAASSNFFQDGLNSKNCPEEKKVEAELMKKASFVMQSLQPWASELSQPVKGFLSLWAGPEVSRATSTSQTNSKAGFKIKTEPKAALIAQESLGLPWGKMILGAGLAVGSAWMLKRWILSQAASQAYRTLAPAIAASGGQLIRWGGEAMQLYRGSQTLALASAVGLGIATLGDQMIDIISKMMKWEPTGPLATASREAPEVPKPAESEQPQDRCEKSDAFNYPEIQYQDLKLGKKLGAGCEVQTYEVLNYPGSVLLIHPAQDPQNFLNLKGFLHKLKRIFVSESSLKCRFESRLNYQHELSRAISLHYEGAPIVPAIQGVLRNDQCQIYAFLMEKIPGTPLQSAVYQGILNEDELKEVQRKLEDQLSLIHREGFVHGDLNHHFNNVMVFRHHGEMRVRLIDFKRSQEKAVVEQVLVQRNFDRLRRTYEFFPEYRRQAQQFLSEIFSGKQAPEGVREIFLENWKLEQCEQAPRVWADFQSTLGEIAQQRQLPPTPKNKRKIFSEALRKVSDKVSPTEANISLSSIVTAMQRMLKK